VSCSRVVNSAELTIEQALNLALRHSFEIKMAHSELNAQSAKHISSWLDLGPRLSASYNHVFYDGKQSINMGGQDLLVRDDVVKTGKIELIQPLTAIFPLMQNARLMGKQKDIKESAVKLSKAQLAFKVAELYLRAQQSERVWEIAKVSVEASVAQKKEGEARFRVERIHRGNLLKLELFESQSRLNEAQAKAARDIAYFNLKEAVGLSEAPILTPLVTAGEVIFENLPTLEEALNLALSNRQELKQAKLGQDIASITRLASVSKFFPSINFFAQVDRNFGNPGFGGAKNNKMLGFNFNFEFFNSGAHIFQLREASFNSTKALYQGEVLKQAVRLEVMSALTSLNTAQEGLLLAHKAMEQANESYRIEKLQFSSGNGSATELLLAQTAKAQAEGNAAKLITDLKIQITTSFRGNAACALRAI